MPTNARKNRRHKEMIKAGRNASSLVVQYKAEKDAAERALAIERDKVAVLEKELKVLSGEHEELAGGAERAFVEQNLLHATCDQQVVEIQELKAEVSEKDTIVAELHSVIEQQRKHIDKLKAEDKDAAKLRRRLQKVKDDLSIAHKQIRDLKSKEVF